MGDFGTVGLVILLVTFVITYQGLKEFSFFEKYSFKVDNVLINKEYYRLISSGFLHVDWRHFAFNMLSLYFFSASVEQTIGIVSFIIIYLVSLIGGNLFALYFHRNHSDYSAVGASGAVMGIIFASIALFPSLKIGFLFIPYRLSAWIFGLLYILYTIYGIKSDKDNIGHEAHLGGGIVGMLMIGLLAPSTFIQNYWAVIIILSVSLIFLYFLIKIPHKMLVHNPLKRAEGMLTIDDKYNTQKVNDKKELDRLLGKIKKKGMDGLTEKEKIELKRLSS